VARERFDFWSVLADEQGREPRRDIPGDPIPVALTRDELGAAIDIILENIFTHTPAGTAYRVAVTESVGSVVLTVDDDGPGFPSEKVVLRGASGVGSTGLGLDIVRRAAERSGGGLTLGTSATGGARLIVTFGRA
jgi:signal transduction histidine kinase